MPSIFIQNEYSPYFLTNSAEELCYGAVFIALGVGFYFVNPLIKNKLIPFFNISD